MVSRDVPAMCQGRSNCGGGSDRIQEHARLSSNITLRAFPLGGASRCDAGPLRPARIGTRTIRPRSPWALDDWLNPSLSGRQWEDGPFPDECHAGLGWFSMDCDPRRRPGRLSPCSGFGQYRNGHQALRSIHREERAPISGQRTPP